MDTPAPQPVPASSAVGFGTPPRPAESQPPSRLTRMRAPLLTAAVVGGLTVALHFRDPHTSGSWGLCPFKLFTGLDCPGCGSLRAVNDLTNGDISAAASSNLLFVLMVPVLVLWWLGWVRRSWTGDQGRAASGRGGPTRERHAVWITVFAVVMVLFGVIRNLPFGGWLAS